MKKFINEYKAARCKSEPDFAKRERVTVTTHHDVMPASTSELPLAQPVGSASATQAGTIRTEEYKRDLAEFQARRSAGPKDMDETPEKLKRCGRHSLPVSCANCSDHDNTFTYEKKSAVKYKKKKRARSITPEKIYEGVPNIQFLFQNQVFMPGHYQTSFSDPQKCKRQSRRSFCRSPDFVGQKHIDFKENETIEPPEFFKNNSLPFDLKDFLEGCRSEEEVDGLIAAGDGCVPSSGSVDDKLSEVMSELNHLDQWADEQLLTKSPNTSRSDDSKSDTSAYGLPIASARNLDINSNKAKIWNHGKWGVVPVQVKKLNGVTVKHVKKKQSIEINILRKCRHPNIILLMGIYPDINNNVHIICERCVDSLFGILHVQGKILSAQTAVQYALDIANALVFLRMQGFLHTQLNSMSIMITAHDTAKLADIGSCANLNKTDKSLERINKDYEVYAAEPQYVNIDDALESKSSESEPLLSAAPSETYLKWNAVSKPYEEFNNSELYRWQAPELFVPDEEGMVRPCSKSDAYSLSLVLWESCNASIPWKMLTYEKLKEQYTLWETGMDVPQDGTYPGALLALLQSGLKVKRCDRIDLETLQRTLQAVKRDLDDIGYIIIPARLPNKKSTFSTTVWDTTSPTDSECQSPQTIEHKASVHVRNREESSTESSDKDTKSDATPHYETIKKSYSNATYSVAQKSIIPDDDNPDCISRARYELLPEKNFASACSTPIAKIRAKLKDIETPGTLHRSDSTEYCSILSPNRTLNLGLNDTSNKDQSERSTMTLSRSFTPKSYKPLHIKVPEYNLDSIKPLLKDRNSNEKSTYNFDIKNYSLPSTPIARSNKLRKNAWLSGDMSKPEKKPMKPKGTIYETPIKEGQYQIVEVAPDTEPKSSSCSPETRASSDNSAMHGDSTEYSPMSNNTVVKEGLTALKRSNPPQDYSPETDDTRERTWSFKTSLDRNNPKYKVDDDVLASMNVKPLVAIHERWIYEANRKAGRSMSLPEHNSFRSQVSAVKPASHCVDTLQKSLPQLYMKKPIKPFRMSSSLNSSGGNWDQFCQARDNIAKGLNFAARDPERHHTWNKDLDKGTDTDDRIDLKTDQATDTRGIEEFIRDLIRNEFQQLIQEMDDTSSVASHKTEDLVNKGVSNIMESLNNDDRPTRKEPLKSFSRIKINGNNKPLLQITFNCSGENSLQVLDNRVNVTLCDNTGASNQKLNVSMEDNLTEDIQINALKRCQAFNAIQEARSTEDLYIDDDLSTHMNENFGGKVRLIPLHGSLHELLCEKEDDCCLVKVKQENGCDTIYFRCDNSETESRDAIDGCDLDRDTVVFKRSISLVEERIQRIPKDKRAQTPIPKAKEKVRPKSEMFPPIRRETRVLSNSSPSLVMNDTEVEVNIENVMSYQDSSSDECINVKCQELGDDFEQLERKIEEDIASKMGSGCGYMEKISEENLSALIENE